MIYNEKRDINFVMKVKEARIKKYKKRYEKHRKKKEKERTKEIKKESSH